MDEISKYGRGGAPGLLLIGIGIDFGVVEIRGPPSLVSNMIVSKTVYIPMYLYCSLQKIRLMK